MSRTTEELWEIKCKNGYTKIDFDDAFVICTYEDFDNLFRALITNDTYCLVTGLFGEVQCIVMKRVDVISKFTPEMSQLFYEDYKEDKLMG
jgi:hypothetical protein